ncbi:hypothetical protein NM688_g5802 [Phlebia brevispora]|uniref:Uncharacterized protein n=1 Tax=Phlebia brevispora TaxID=194682 RepID=A0ACC1SPJ8_9APHY|nr:hypothetical protein NM688_g5802 [Phlebia brevispora]
MSLVGFTFGSFGDIITIIQIARAIQKSLSEKSGATAECRMLIEYLDTFTGTVEIVKSLAFPGRSPPDGAQNASDGNVHGITTPLRSIQSPFTNPEYSASANAILRSLWLCDRLLREFKVKLAPYEESLLYSSGGSSRNRLRDFWRKVDWSSIKADAIDLRRNLAAQVQHITLILSILTADPTESSQTVTPLRPDRVAGLVPYEDTPPVVSRSVSMSGMSEISSSFSAASSIIGTSSSPYPTSVSEASLMQVPIPKRAVSSPATGDLGSVVSRSMPPSQAMRLEASSTSRGSPPQEEAEEPTTQAEATTSYSAPDAPAQHEPPITQTSAVFVPPVPIPTPSPAPIPPTTVAAQPQLAISSSRSLTTQTAAASLAAITQLAQALPLGIRLKDILNKEYTVPIDFCRNMAELDKYLRFYFSSNNRKGKAFVERAKYYLETGDTGEFVVPGQWDQISQPGKWAVMRAIILRDGDIDPHACPACSTLNDVDIVEGQEIICSSCDASFKVFLNVKDDPKMPPDLRMVAIPFVRLRTTKEALKSFSIEADEEADVRAIRRMAVVPSARFKSMFAELPGSGFLTVRKLTAFAQSEPAADPATAQATQNLANHMTATS